MADFRSKYVPEGLDLTELRAIWHNLPHWDEGSENNQERGKAEWKAALKSKLDNNAFKAAYGCLADHLVRNPVYEVGLSMTSPSLRMRVLIINCAGCIV